MIRWPRFLLWIFALLGCLPRFAVDPGEGGGAEPGGDPDAGGDDPDGGADPDAPAVDPDAGKEPAPGPQDPADDPMLKAITAGLKKTGAGADDDQPGGQPVAAAPKKPGAADPKDAKVAKPGAQPGAQPSAADKAAEDARKKTEVEEAKKRDEAERADLRKKKADDFMPTKEERQALSVGANRRIHQLHRYAKAREEEAVTLAEQNESLRETRDTIMTVLQEHKATGDDLMPLLEYNLAIKEGRLDDALKMVEEVRTGILSAMGKEAPGFDPLDQFADLKKRVEDNELTRVDALALAKARRVQEHDQNRRQTSEDQTRNAQARERSENDALTAIERWEKGLSVRDLQYAKKRDKLLPVIQRVIQRYPPNLWLEEIQERYGQIEVAANPNPGGNGEDDQPQPLRPSGGRAGAPAAKTMEGAIAQGLGYENLGLG